MKGTAEPEHQAPARRRTASSARASASTTTGPRTSIKAVGNYGEIFERNVGAGPRRSKICRAASTRCGPKAAFSTARRSASRIQGGPGDLARLLLASGADHGPERIRPSGIRRQAHRRASSPLYNPKVRGLVFQAALVIALILIVAWFVDNTLENLRRARHRLRLRLPLDGAPASRSAIAGSPSRRTAATCGPLWSASSTRFGRRHRHRPGDAPRLPDRHRAAVVQLAGRQVATIYVETIRNIPLLL